MYSNYKNIVDVEEARIDIVYFEVVPFLEVKDVLINVVGSLVSVTSKIVDGNDTEVEKGNYVNI